MRFLPVWLIKKDPQEQLRQCYVTSYEVRGLGDLGMEIVLKFTCPLAILSVTKLGLYSYSNTGPFCSKLTIMPFCVCPLLIKKTRTSSLNEVGVAEHLSTTLRWKNPVRWFYNYKPTSEFAGFLSKLLF